MGVAGVLGTRSRPPAGMAGAAEVSSATAPALLAPSPSPSLWPPAAEVSGSPGAARPSAGPGHAKATTDPPPVPAASTSAGPLAPLAPAPDDHLREVLPMVAKAPGYPGQTFGGACYSVQPFTLTLSVAVPAGFDEARLEDSLQWTVRTQTVVGPLAFHGLSNHARITVTDDGQATPPGREPDAGPGRPL